MVTTTSSKVFLFFTVSVFASALITIATAQSPRPRRHIDIQVPKNVSIEVKLKKDKEEEFQDLNNELETDENGVLRRVIRRNKSLRRRTKTRILAMRCVS